MRAAPVRHNRQHAAPCVRLTAGKQDAYQPACLCLQTATHARRISSSDGSEPVTNRSMKKTFSNRGRNLTGLLMSGLPPTPEEAQQEH